MLGFVKLPIVLIGLAWVTGAALLHAACWAYQAGRRLLGRWAPTAPFRVVAAGWCAGAVIHEPLFGMLVAGVLWGWRTKPRDPPDPPPDYEPLEANLTGRLAFGGLCVLGATYAAFHHDGGWTFVSALAALWFLIGPRLGRFI